MYSPLIPINPKLAIEFHMRLEFRYHPKRSTVKFCLNYVVISFFFNSGGDIQSTGRVTLSSHGGIMVTYLDALAVQLARQ
jgi:hypothetical protein